MHKKIILSLLIIPFTALLCSHCTSKNNLNHVKKALEKGVTYLISNQNEDGSVSLENDEMFKVWETTNSILAVQTADRTRTLFLKRAIGFLLSCQRQDGSFYSAVSFEEGHYCMETTPVSLLALAAAEKDVSKGVRFILNKQMPDGSWEIGIPRIETDRFFPSVTGYVLNTLFCLSISSEQIPKGIDYLLRAQHKDGSWGESGIYYDTPYYATHVNLFALRLFGLEKSENYKKAVAFIKRNQNEDGSWGVESADRPSKALRTSLALNSLLISPMESDSESIEKGVRWILRNQDLGGYWSGGCFKNFPRKNEDIFCTATVLLALKRYQSYKRGKTLLCLI